MRRRVWLSPCPGVGLRAVITHRVLGLVRILYRDIDGKCGAEWVAAFAAVPDFIIDR